ncbi:hypothetical protein BLAT2472_10846 [Burkholderia latens]
MLALRYCNDGETGQYFGFSAGRFHKAFVIGVGRLCRRGLAEFVLYFSRFPEIENDCGRKISGLLIGGKYSVRSVLNRTLSCRI